MDKRGGRMLLSCIASVTLVQGP